MNDLFSSDIGSLKGAKVSGHYCGAEFTGVVFWNDCTGVGVDFDSPVTISTGSVRASGWIGNSTLERCGLHCNDDCCRFSVNLA